MKGFIYLSIFFVMFLSGCSINNDSFVIKKNNIKKYLQVKHGNSTPMENIYNISLDCFDNVGNNRYLERVGFNWSNSIGSSVNFQSVYYAERNNISKKVFKHNSFEVSEGEFSDDGFYKFGDEFNFNFSEDLNGEFIANVFFSSVDLKNNSYLGADEFSIVSKIFIEQSFYPKNKIPFKVFENESSLEICYITVKW